jgi:hypothetical protein
MSALEPTPEELNDLITISIPRVIAIAMNNPEGEWYSDEIVNKAFNQALEEQ